MRTRGRPLEFARAAGVGDALAAERMLAPDLGVREVEGEALDGTAWFAASLVGLESGDMLWNLGGAASPAAKIASVRWTSSRRAGARSITPKEDAAEAPPEHVGFAAKGARGGGRPWRSCLPSAAARSAGGRV